MTQTKNPQDNTTSGAMPRRDFLKSAAVFAAAASAAPLCAQPKPPAPGAGAELLSVKRIWSATEKSDFRESEMVWFKGRFYASFLERGVARPDLGKKSSMPDGRLQIISSVDGEQWEPVRQFGIPGQDFRSPQITVTPDGRLLATATLGRGAVGGMAWFSTDGKTWSERINIAPPDLEFWDIGWKGNTAYVINYVARDEEPVRLYRSVRDVGDWNAKNGIRFEVVNPNLLPNGYPDGRTPVQARIRLVEPCLHFTDGGTCYVLTRRQSEIEGMATTGMMGISKPPYQNWKWTILKDKVAMPDMIRLPDGRFVAGTRLYRDLPKNVPGGRRTALVWVYPKEGRIEEIITLPSGNHTGSTGVVYKDGIIWVAYHSGHEGKLYTSTSIYLAKVRLK
ncbi:MAG: hypothetical protein FJ399_21410 [Verrucomicrobia bacterium]|nr:hypothetical protein [Verrucomicrobiota bacterium]